MLGLLVAVIGIFCLLGIGADWYKHKQRCRLREFTERKKTQLRLRERKIYDDSIWRG